MRERPTLFSSTETLDIYLYWNIQYIGLTTYNPTYTTNNFHPKLKIHFIFLICKTSKLVMLVPLSVCFSSDTSCDGTAKLKL